MDEGICNILQNIQLDVYGHQLNGFDLISKINEFAPEQLTHLMEDMMSAAIEGGHLFVEPLIIR